MVKLNCWEMTKCGREPGGKNIEELGVCAAAIDTSSNGINHGANGGRLCWAVAGTLSGKKVCGHFAKNKPSCLACDVFKQIKAEEGADFSLTKLNLKPSSSVMHRLLLYNLARYELQQTGTKD